MPATPKEQGLRLRVQRAWDRVMDEFYEQVDLIKSTEFEITDADRIAAVRCVVDDWTADAYEEWIGDA